MALAMDAEQLNSWNSKQWQKYKVPGFVLISVALLFCGIALAFTITFAVPKMSKVQKEDDYPVSIVKDTSSSCWDTTVFATTYDPFYRWAVSSSLPGELGTDEGDEQGNRINSQEGTILYQKASIWRVSGDPTKKNNKTISVYSSPDPLILGGKHTKKSKSMVAKMIINWGISVRYCFSGLNLTSDTSKNTVNDDPCLYTAPIVRTSGNSSTYAALMIGIPYGNSSLINLPSNIDITSFYIDRQATYLTNFISNARTKFKDRLVKLKRDKGTHYYVFNGTTCGKSESLFLTPDVYSYRGIPALHCACSGRFCIEAFNPVDNVIKNLDLHPDASGCSRGTFWNGDDISIADPATGIIGNVWFKTYAYSTRWNNKHVEFHFYLNVSLLSLSVDITKRLEEFTSCVEDFIQADSPDSYTFTSSLSSECQSDVGYVVIESMIFNRSGSFVPVQEIYNAAVENHESNDNVLCGLGEGQVELVNNHDSLCMWDLENNEVKAMEALEKHLNKSTYVTNVNKFTKTEWEKGRPQRVQMFIAILTALVTIIVTLHGLFSRDLQEAEKFILKQMTRFSKFVGKTIGFPIFRTGVRAVVLLGVIIWNLFNVFAILNSAEIELRVATSETLLQQMNGAAFLVTTSSTIQVIPEWAIFFVACCIMVLVFVISVFLLYVRMEYAQEFSKSSESSEHESTMLT